LALGAEERRDKLRKAAGSGTYAKNRRYLNGGTHVREPYVPHAEGGKPYRDAGGTRRTETSK